MDTPGPPSEQTTGTGTPDDADAGPEPFRSAHTPGFPQLLDELGVSLLVTTYQAGRLVIVRPEGDRLNTHFRSFPSPMGLALDPSAARLAIGTSLQIWEFRDVPDVASRLEPKGSHDACFLPRSAHVTGNVAIHEMAYGRGNELWFVNTRFSCLATIDPSASFAPRWRPPFISKLEPSNRCHLNGMAMHGGLPRYVTALGTADEPAGWRKEKARGGVLMEVESGEVVASGLSMPHSPRIHAGRLWACESGAGTLGVVDPATGRYEPVAAAPGFTRGLDFAGRFAFVGLSQVRESAVFSGIPITERLAERDRTCGVAVVDIVTGSVVGLLRFDGAVQEIFAVAVLPRRFPELVNEDEALLADSFVVPAESLPDVAESVRARPAIPA
ncbi:hypothetical protein OJF2_77720 [Aquisphaera giovannonii]|uniref:Conserved hypothetical protein CHP03032 domain-containing protein n=1 Tax=Aquisphaera giovannonii TaxID=406548 RepID=A0A5B9WH47_9BACT|nr:TIGR03032 family protein [Aquisphaera giovannonii]QEH39160.1 hypothetical protein OJF2_77720 [Aquisphaera giovannonii]